MYRILQEAWRLGKVGESLSPVERRSVTNAPGFFHHSICIRHVDAGSCNGCEQELQALNGPHYSLEQSGFRFTASPRHADVLTVTGPVTQHMRRALLETHDAMAAPKRVIAVGDCACSGGVFRGSYAVRDGVAAVLPVDVFIPGCPPDPNALLHGLQQASGDIDSKKD